MRFIIFVSFAVLIAATANAQTCAGITPSATIIACTANIAVDQTNKAKLFSDFLDRSAAEQTEKQYALSVADAKSAMYLNSQDPTAYMRLANAYKAAGDLDDEAEAGGMIGMAGGLVLESPNVPPHATTQDKYEALAIRARYENVLGLWEEAMADESAAIAMSPNPSEAYQDRAETYGRQRDFGAELANLNKAIALAPTDVRPLYDRIRLYEFEHRYADAVRDETTTLQIESTPPLGQDGGPGPEEYNMRCWDRAHTAELKDALSDCHKAIALVKNIYGVDGHGNKFETPSTSDMAAHIYDSTGYVYLKFKIPTKAIYYYSMALGAHPKFASSLYGRALAEQALHQTTPAATDFAAAKAIDPKINSDFGT